MAAASQQENDNQSPADWRDDCRPMTEDQFTEESCLKPLAIPLRGMLPVSARRDRKYSIFEEGVVS